MGPGAAWRGRVSLKLKLATCPLCERGPKAMVWQLSVSTRSERAPIVRRFVVAARSQPRAGKKRTTSQINDQNRGLCGTAAQYNALNSAKAGGSKHPLSPRDERHDGGPIRVVE